MEEKKRRSVLRKSISVDATPRIKRRISFSGKNLVREFQSEKEPKTWNNSYEISDHLNVDETASNLCDPKRNPSRSSLKKSHELKENITQDISPINKNVSVANNNSELYTTKDFINVTYQRSRILNIDNSVDITLHNCEKTKDVGSFYIYDNEKNLFGVKGGRKNNGELKAVNSDLRLQLDDCDKVCCDDGDIGVTVYSEYMDEVQCAMVDVTSNENKQQKDAITIYMNDSMSTSWNEPSNSDNIKTTNDKRKTIQQTVAMVISPTKDKENIMPTSNVTINRSYHMEIDDENFFHPQTRANVEKESQAFQDKLNRLSLFQVSDDNMQMDITQMAEVNRGAVPKVKYRPTINMNQPIEVSPAAKAQTITSRQTVNFNENIHEGSPVKVRNPIRQTINFNEDIRVSPVKPAQNLSTRSDLSIPESIRKPGQPPKVVVRKIAPPIVNKSKNQADLEQNRILRFKKKQEQEAQQATTKEVSTAISNEAPVAEKSFNMSMDSVKNLSLSSDSSLPLIPSEFKVSTFKQLNDEIERGKIHVYSNAPKTPNTDRKKAKSHFSKNLLCSEAIKHGRTLVFKDADISTTLNDSSTKKSKSTKTNDYFDFNTTQEFIDREKKRNPKSRYSQADDMMLDNTSFLTRAKLGDETASRNSSKRDATQTNNIDILFDETLREAASQIVGDSYAIKSVKGNNESVALSDMFQNAKPIFAQTIVGIKDFDFVETQYNESHMDLNETNNHEIEKLQVCATVYHNHTMDIENEKTRMGSANMDFSPEYARATKTKMLNEENAREDVIARRTVYHNNDIEEQETANIITIGKPCRSIMIAENIDTADDMQVEEPHNVFYNQRQKEHHSRHTMYFDNEYIENGTPPQEGCTNVPLKATQTKIQRSDAKTLSSIFVENRNLDNFKSSAEKSNISRQSKHFDNYDNEIETTSLSTNSRCINQNLITDKLTSKEQDSHNLNNKPKNIENNPRTTIFFKNTNADISLGENAPKQPENTKMHFDNEEIDREENIHLQIGSKKHVENIKRQTLYINDDIETEPENNSDLHKLESKETQSISKSSNRTIHLNNDNIVSETYPCTETKRRQTVHFYQDIDLEESFENKNTEISSKCSTRTMHMNNANSIISHLDIKDPTSTQCTENVETNDGVGKRHQTLHYHKDIDLEESFENKNTEESSKSSKRTINLKSDNIAAKISHIDTKDPTSTQCTENVETNDGVGKRRQTLHYHNDIDLEESFENKNTEESSKSSKRTTNFNSDNAAAEICILDTKEPSTQFVENVETNVGVLKRRQTFHYHQDIELDESHGNENIEGSSKCLNNAEIFHLEMKEPSTQSTGNIETSIGAGKRRQTFNCHEDIDLEESLENKNDEGSSKSSKRTIHLNNAEISHLEMSTENIETNVGVSERRQTFHCHQDIDFEESFENKSIEGFSKSLKRTTHVNNAEIADISHLKESSHQSTENIATNSGVSERRQTFHCHQDIDLEESFENKNLEEPSKNSRRTINFNNDNIVAEICHLEAKEPSSTQCAENAETNDGVDKHRQTFHCHHDMELGESFENKNTEGILKSPKRTMHLQNDIIAEISRLEIKEPSSTQCTQNVETNYGVDKRRQTLHCDQDMNLDESFERINQVYKEGNNQIRGDDSHEPKSLCPLLRTTSIYYEQNNAILQNGLPLVDNVSTRQTKEGKSFSNKGQTLHFDKHNDISIEQGSAKAADNCKIPETNKKSVYRGTLYFEPNDANLVNELSMSEIPANKGEDKYKTLNVDNKKNDISIEGGSTKENLNIAESSAKPLNAAKMSLLRHNNFNNQNSLSKNMKSFTPIKSDRQRLCEMTPGTREFVEEEKRSNLDNDKFTSPTTSRISMKRLPVHLTPIISIAKKQQALLFDEKHKTSVHLHNIVRKTNKSLLNAVLDDDDHRMDISGIVPNESIILTPPQPRMSRIPIPVSSGKKSNEPFDHYTGETVKEQIDRKEYGNDLDVIEMDDDEHESIQIMRRATTFTQRRTENLELNNFETHLEKQPMDRLSIFECNPITISDVSVYFTAQRKSNECTDNNTVVHTPNKTIVMDSNIISGINDFDTRKSFLQKPYINLTCDSPLENIDQTRLSLVRTLSDDDDDDEDENAIVLQDNDVCHEDMPVNDEPQLQCAVITSPPVTENLANECNVENVPDLKYKRQSVINLRNVSAVCRKCKRCQDTFLNETTSSTADSFVLPALPELPDLRLDRLRRLRKRPTISEVDTLWKRVSLDRTIINPLNLSDDETQFFSNADDDNIEDEFNPAIIALRQHQRAMDECHIEIEATLQSRKISFCRRKPFVSRLEDLLRNSSSNWIFDYQMQIRGIYIFSHRKIYTSSILLTFEEVDDLGMDIKLKSVKLEKNQMPPEKNWKPIDFVLDFQLKLNLPYDLQTLCEDSNEAGLFKMLQTIDQIFMETLKMGNDLQKVVVSNVSSIIRDDYRTYVRKNIRKPVKTANNEYIHIEKTTVKVELMNLKKLSFKDIAAPPLHQFREEIHLLPVGLEFLHTFLPNPLSYLKNPC